MLSQLSQSHRVELVEELEHISSVQMERGVGINIEKMEGVRPIE